LHGPQWIKARFPARGDPDPAPAASRAESATRQIAASAAAAMIVVRMAQATDAGLDEFVGLPSVRQRFGSSFDPNRPPGP
jgi:hypothetical protein